MVLCRSRGCCQSAFCRRTHRAKACTWYSPSTGAHHGKATQILEMKENYRYIIQLPIKQTCLFICISKHATFWVRWILGPVPPSLSTRYFRPLGVEIRSVASASEALAAEVHASVGITMVLVETNALRPTFPSQLKAFRAPTLLFDGRTTGKKALVEATSTVRISLNIVIFTSARRGLQ